MQFCWEGDGEEKGVLCTRRKMPLPRVLKVLYLQVDFQTDEISSWGSCESKDWAPDWARRPGGVFLQLTSSSAPPHTPGVHIQVCPTQVCPPVPWFLESLPSKPGEGPADDSALV